MSTSSSAVRVWDIPTRLFHWLLVILIGFSWWSAEQRMMDWHALSGVFVLGLIVFRLIWGVIGGSTARFSHFLRSPGYVIAYLRQSTKSLRAAGHNPVGGYSVVLMLLLLAVQTGTGLFAVDVDGIDSGPLSFLVSFDQGRAAAGVHHLSFTLLQIVAGLHIIAILFYLFVRKRDLVRPMVTGSDKDIETRDGELAPASPLRLIAAAAIAAAFAWAAWKGFWL
ncbi:MAG: cytochrome b/b6 domain-containing protein [Novosphingobium sp.]